MPAVLLFAGAGQQFVEHRATLARIARSGVPRAGVPVTMYSEHSGMALALTCLGLAFVILAFRNGPGVIEEPRQLPGPQPQDPGSGLPGHG